MDNFPIAKSYLNKSCKTNKKLKVLMPQYEKALDENQKVRQEILAIKPEISKYLFNASLYDQAANGTRSERLFAKNTVMAVETCYEKIAHLEHLMNKVELGNILSYAVKCKEDETNREIASLKEAFQEEAKQLDMLENRSAVQYLRQLQSLLAKNQKDLSVLERELKNMEQQRTNKMKRATDYRNRKMINILQTRKLIHELEIKLIVAPVARQSQDDAKDSDSQESKDISVTLKGPILQSALDFLSNFMHKNSHEKKTEEKDDETKPEEEKALQSILHRRSGTPSPAKQVRFVASPDMASVHIVERISSMSDDGSVEAAYTEPGKKAEEQGSQEGWEEEVYEHKEYPLEGEDVPSGEEECEETEEEGEYEYNTEENEEMQLQSTENEETYMVESSGDEESGNKKQGQAKKLPIESEREEESDASWEEAQEGVEMEKMDVEGNAKDSPKTYNTVGLGKLKSDNKKKPEILNVVIIPPPQVQKPDPVQMPSTSRYSRFKLSASQKSSSDAMDVDEEEASLPQNMEEEDEDDNEIPMAQPTPATHQFKQPPPVESPPSSELAESMLNFSTPNCEFNDDFWLNASNTANIDTDVDQFYNL